MLNKEFGFYSADHREVMNDISDSIFKASPNFPKEKIIIYKLSKILSESSVHCVGRENHVTHS